MGEQLRWSADGVTHRYPPRLALVVHIPVAAVLLGVAGLMVDQLLGGVGSNTSPMASGHYVGFIRFLAALVAASLLFLGAFLVCYSRRSVIDGVRRVAERSAGVWPLRRTTRLEFKDIARVRLRQERWRSKGGSRPVGALYLDALGTTIRIAPLPADSRGAATRIASMIGAPLELPDIE